MTARRTALILAAGLLAAALSGCSAGGEPPKTGPAASAAKAQASFKTTLTRIDVTLADKTPKESARAGQAIGLALQKSGITMFSYDGSAQGKLGVLVSDRLDDKERKSLDTQIKSLDKKWKVDTGTYDGWRFRLIGPLKNPVKDARIPDDVGKAVATSLSPILTGWVQSGVVESKSVAVTFSGKLTGGTDDIEKARLALAKALGAKDRNVRAEPLP